MAEEHTEPIDEKEGKRKIKVVADIDERLAIQGQAYMKGQLKEALMLAYEIIELAKSEGLISFIEEQEQLIARIKKLLEKREEEHRKWLRAVQEKSKLEKLKELRIELKNLENIFNTAFELGDFLKTEVTIKKAKNLLSQLDDKEVKNKWQDFEKKHLEAKLKKKLIKRAQEVIEESIELKEKFCFDDLKSKLTNIIKQLKENNVEENLKELEYIQNDTLNAEKVYLNVIENIQKLIKEVEILQKYKDFKNFKTKCEALLKLAKSIGKKELIKQYTKLLIKLQKDLKFEELKENVKKLNEEGLNLLKKGDISVSIAKFEMIKEVINYYLEEL